MFIVYLLPSHSALIFNTFRLSLCVTFVYEENVQYACLDNISLFLHFPVSRVGQQEAGGWAESWAGCRHTGTVVKLSALCRLQATG